MNLYSYVVASDTGFAPNPFGKYCTLACCKPSIRLSAAVGDWVVGTSSVKTVGAGRLVYAMRVTEKLPLEEYSDNPRFQYKKPSVGLREERGDNIYSQKGKNWHQRTSYHDADNMPKDLRGKYALISDHFVYLGADAIPISKQFVGIVKKGPGYKCHFPAWLVEAFVEWVETKVKTAHRGTPFDFSERIDWGKNCGCSDGKGASCESGTRKGRNR